MPLHTPYERPPSVYTISEPLPCASSPSSLIFRAGIEPTIPFTLSTTPHVAEVAEEACSMSLHKLASGPAVLYRIRLLASMVDLRCQAHQMSVFEDAREIPRDPRVSPPSLLVEARSATAMLTDQVRSRKVPRSPCTPPPRLEVASLVVRRDRCWKGPPPWIEH